MNTNTTNSRLLLIFFFFVIITLNSFIAASLNGGSSIHNENDIKLSDFPSGFLFGAATSAYQIEGAFLEDGKSLSNWDVFNHEKLNGSIEKVANGDIAVDHYHLYLKDIEIMHSLGINAYRFSISWSRVLPRGRFGDINPSGILFYNNVIDNLLLKGIEPFVTIHHDDFPQELQDRYGSWLSPLMQEDFLHFAEICFKNYGDRVKNWITINEPNIVALLGYAKGQYPPAHCSKPFGNCSIGNSDIEPLIVVHNMLLAHGKAAKLYRERFKPKQGGSIGIVAHCYAFRPLRDNDHDDQEAASRASTFFNAWVFDPVIFGDYPPEMRLYHGNELPKFSPEEKKYLKNSIDFIGINHYSTLYAKDCLHSSCSGIGDRAFSGFVDSIGERDGVAIGEPIPMPTFYVVPEGMEETINYLKTRYHNKPMFVTENGYCSEKQKGQVVEDVLQDVKRVEFHKSYLASLANAIRGGADVRGYFIWTLMDNYEWAYGYNKRFGMYYVEKETMRRIPKLSAKWYKSFLLNKSKAAVASSSSTDIISSWEMEYVRASQPMDNQEAYI